MDKPNRILIVDDEEANRELLEAILVPLGYEAILAGDGKEALEKVREIPPDLILLDIMMPKMDGFEVARRLKDDEDTRTIPIVMVTALRETGERIKGIECGADDFLSKPFDRHELMARVKSLLRIKHLHDELKQKNDLLYRILNRYVADEVSTLILDDPDRYLKLGGEIRIVTVLFADIRGFTKFAESSGAKLVVGLLNRVFAELTNIIFQNRGTFDKYIGDAIMAFYGAPVSYDDDVLRALQTALEMQEGFARIRQESEDEDVASLGLGIGINTGEAVVGNIGSERIMDYTVIGDTANVASRLQEKASGGKILISHSTYLHIQDQVVVREMPPLQLSGKQVSTTIYELKELV